MGARFQPHGEACNAHASALQLSKLAAQRFSGRVTRREQLAFLASRPWPLFQGALRPVARS
jgi:hypothetical protein